MTDRNTNSGVNKQLVRRLQRATGVNYTSCLRQLEDILPAAREHYVKLVEQKVADGKDFRQ